MLPSYFIMHQVVLKLSRKENSGVRLIIGNLKSDHEFTPSEGFIRNFVATTDADILPFLKESTTCAPSTDSVFFKAESDPAGYRLKLADYLECMYDRDVVVLELIKVLKQLGQDDTIRERLETLHSFLRGLPNKSEASYAYSKSDFVLKVTYADRMKSIYMKGIDMNSLLFQFFFCVSKSDTKISIRSVPLETQRARTMLGIFASTSDNTTSIDVGKIVRPAALIITDNQSKLSSSKSPAGGSTKSTTKANSSLSAPVAFPAEKQLLLVQCLSELFNNCNDCDIKAMCIIIDRLSNATSTGRIKLSVNSMKAVHESFQQNAHVKVPSTPNPSIEENNLLRKLHLCFLNSNCQEFKECPGDMVWNFLTKGRGRILYKYDSGGKSSTTHSNNNGNANGVDAGICYSSTVWTLIKSCGITAGNWQSFLRDFDTFKQMWDLTSLQLKVEGSSTESTSSRKVCLYATNAPGDPTITITPSTPNGVPRIDTVYKTFKLIEKHPFTAIAFESVDVHTTNCCHVYTRRTSFIDSFIVKSGSSPKVKAAVSGGEKIPSDGNGNPTGDDGISKSDRGIHPLNIDCDADGNVNPAPFSVKSARKSESISPLAHSYAAALTQTKPQHAASLNAITSTSRQSKQISMQPSESSVLRLVQQIRVFFESVSPQEVLAMGKLMDRLSNIPSNELCVDCILHAKRSADNPGVVYKDEDSVKKLVMKLEPLGIVDLIEFIKTGTGKMLFAFRSDSLLDSVSSNPTSTSAVITYSEFCKEYMSAQNDIRITPPQWQSFFRDYDIFKQAWRDTSTKRGASETSLKSKGIVAIPLSDLGLFDCHSVGAVSQKLTKSKALAASALLDKHPIGTLLFQKVENEPFFYKRKYIAADLTPSNENALSKSLSNSWSQGGSLPTIIRTSSSSESLVQHVVEDTQVISGDLDPTESSLIPQSISKLSRNTSEDNMQRVLPQHLLDDDEAVESDQARTVQTAIVSKSSQCQESNHMIQPSSTSQQVNIENIHVIPSIASMGSVNGMTLSHDLDANPNLYNIQSAVAVLSENSPDIEMTFQLLSTYLPVVFSMPQYEINIVCNLIQILESVDGQLILQEGDAFKATLFECLHLGLGADKSYSPLIDFVTSGRGHILFHYSKSSESVTYSALYMHCLESNESVTSNCWLQFFRNIDHFKQIYLKYYGTVTDNSTGVHTPLNMHQQYNALMSHVSISADLGLGLGLGLDFNHVDPTNPSALFYGIMKENPTFTKIVIMLMNKHRTKSLLIQTTRMNEALTSKYRQLSDERVELLRKIVEMEEQLKIYSSSGSK